MQQKQNSMSDTYLVMAKTVEEAIAIANREYARDGKEISYEILEMPKKGIFGIGARDAKLKVTVTESASSQINSELNSIVADLRSMKIHTNRGGESEEKSQKNPQKPRQNQPREQNRNQNQNQGQNPQKSAEKSGDKSQGQKQNPPKAENKPKAESKPQTEKTQKPVENVEKEQKPQVQVKAEPAPAPVPQQEEKSEYRSTLNNQAKPSQRRQRRPKTQNTENVTGGEAIIASPVGLTDFTRDNTEKFGSESSSAGRISNDIRRKPRPQKRTPAPAPEAEEAPAKAAEEKELEKLPVENFKVLKGAEAPIETPVEAEAEEENEIEAVHESEDRPKVGVTEAEMNYALEFTNTLLQNMAIDATAKRAECPEGEGYVIEGDANVYPKIDIDGSGTGILIGHHGETLDAVQYLVNLAALRQSKQKGGDYVKIVVDIENYRAKREETLRSLARRMAARAVKYKRNVFLEPMNAYERRIIHSELHDYENVSTHSVGADKNRKIIITYEGPDKVQHPRKSELRGSAEGKAADAKGSVGRGKGENRRPKKIQKMPIEKLPDFLAGDISSDEPDEFLEIED